MTRRVRLARAALATLLLVGALTPALSAGPTGSAAAAPRAGVPAPHGASSDSIRSREYWLDADGIRSAWTTTRGAGVTIAVIDTGIDGTVAELRGAVTGGTDFSGLGAANGQTPVGEDNGHATMVASLAAGRGTGSNSGVIGVAPEASLLSISVGFGAGARDSDAQIAEAVTWAVDHGAKVINMSLTRNTLDWPTSWDTAFLYAEDHDVVVVAAAGNRGSGTDEVGAPATMPGVLAVAGVTQSGVASGQASAQGITLGVAAPSENLVGVIPGGGYVLWDGTSGAAPIVAGVVALVRAAHPELKAPDVINRILATAHDKGPAGPDALYGHGIVDAAAAVRDDVPHVAANPLGDLHEWVRVNRRATPAPAPEGSITVPAPVDSTPVIAQPSDPVGVLLPSIPLLQLVGVPVLIVLLLLFALGGLVVGAVVQFRSLRRTG
ncbi:S8 family serine peptidase [Lysinimonas soli]|uniref:S8 family serine peptidase n=1 Tax=Lysinimonas soli TaxID=1074233 RepID=A0ABW0NMV3_9MICO